METILLMSALLLLVVTLANTVTLRKVEEARKKHTRLPR